MLRVSAEFPTAVFYPPALFGHRAVEQPHVSRLIYTVGGIWAIRVFFPESWTNGNLRNKKTKDNKIAGPTFSVATSDPCIVNSSREVPPDTNDRLRLCCAAPANAMYPRWRSWGT